MAEVFCVRLIWQKPDWEMPVARHPGGLVRFHPIVIRPELEHPAGRKGLALKCAWEQMSCGADGMLILDSDVAVDPQMIGSMLSAIHAEPEAVHTAPVRIWPVSTMREDWTWAHWKDSPSQQIDYEPRWFSFCFTWLPGKLVRSAIKDGLQTWHYPHVDSNMSREAGRIGVPVRVVKDCWPVHVHW